MISKAVVKLAHLFEDMEGMQTIRNVWRVCLGSCSSFGEIQSTCFYGIHLQVLSIFLQEGFAGPIFSPIIITSGVALDK